MEISKTNRVSPARVISPDRKKLIIQFLVKFGCHRHLPATHTLKSIVFESNLMDMSINRHNFFLKDKKEK